MISSHMFYSDNCFSFTSTLADAMCSMDVSRSPDSLILYPRFPYHVPPARVLVRSHFCFMCFLTFTKCGLSTRRRLLVCFPFLLLSCRFVYLCFSLMSFSFCLVDSSLCLPLLLTLSCFSSSTRLLSCYS